MIYKWADKLIIFIFKSGVVLMVNGFRQIWSWKKDKRLYIGFGISTLIGLALWAYTGMKWGIFIFIPPWVAYLFLLGSIKTYADRQEEKKKKKYDYKFDLAGIKHRDNTYPRVIEYTDKHITLLTYIDINTLESFKNKLESVFNISIDKFDGTKDKQVIRLILQQESNVKDVEIFDDEYLERDGIFNIGLDVRSGDIVQLNFNNFANLLIGGLPGGGKSKLIQLIAYMALKYECKVFCVDIGKGGLDYKRFMNKCEMVITNHNDFSKVLKLFKKEIIRRQKLFFDAGAENLKDYNKITGEGMKREYLIIDELGEALEIDVDGLTDKEEKAFKKDIEKDLKSIARLGRALGCNIVAGTQRPDVGVLEGQTRSMFGCRVCFQADKATSLIVLDDKRADELPETPGRAIVKKRKEYFTIQVFKFEKWMINNIKNKKLTKENLKIIGGIENRKTNEIIDIDIEL
jgi:S-DNA-T family DNA segregation ATPase FtsK/SpoIIIE